MTRCRLSCQNSDACGIWPAIAAARNSGSNWRITLGKQRWRSEQRICGCQKRKKNRGDAEGSATLFPNRIHQKCVSCPTFGKDIHSFCVVLILMGVRGLHVPRAGSQEVGRFWINPQKSKKRAIHFPIIHRNSTSVIQRRVSFTVQGPQNADVCAGQAGQLLSKRQHGCWFPTCVTKGC